MHVEQNELPWLHFAVYAANFLYPFIHCNISYVMKIIFNVVMITISLVS